MRKRVIQCGTRTQLGIGERTLQIATEDLRRSLQSLEGTQSLSFGKRVPRELIYLLSHRGHKLGTQAFERFNRCPVVKRLGRTTKHPPQGTLGTARKDNLDCLLTNIQSS